MSILQDLYDNAEHRFGSAIIRPAEVEEMVDDILAAIVTGKQIGRAHV